MIKDIPSKSDFDAVGVALLDQAWDVATALLIDLEQAKQWMDLNEEENYWRSAGIKLSTALAIAHQGAEFLLKGRISAISPMLLILNPPKDWPKPGPDGHIAFSAFRTVDAQDIVRLHDSCAEVPLDKKFASAFEALRIRRNSFMHSINPNVKVDAAALIEEILRIHKVLMPDRNWIDARRQALRESSSSQIWSSDWVEPRLVQEFNEISAVLPPALMLEHFGFDKKRRAYLCSNCTFSSCAEEDFQSYSATLVEKSSTCERLYCFICRETEVVTRNACKYENCEGNVISTEWERCLTCGADF